jgi:hypothetical protein
MHVGICNMHVETQHLFLMLASAFDSLRGCDVGAVEGVCGRRLSLQT